MTSDYESQRRLRSLQRTQDSLLREIENTNALRQLKNESTLRATVSNQTRRRRNSQNLLSLLDMSDPTQIYNPFQLYGKF